jgi:hypothetical protein
MKTIAKLRESDTGGRAKVKRIAMLLSVVALMVVMMAMSVAPAFAAWDAEGGQCRTGDGITTVGSYPPFVKLDRNGDGAVCETLSNQGVYRHYDNRLVF